MNLNSIVKECPKKSSVQHHHDHHHNYQYSDNKLSDLNSGFDSEYLSQDMGGYGSASKYKGTLDGYSESRYNPVRNKPNLSSRSSAHDHILGIVLSVNKDYQNKY